MVKFFRTFISFVVALVFLKLFHVVNSSVIGIFGESILLSLLMVLGFGYSVAPHPFSLIRQGRTFLEPSFWRKWRGRSRKSYPSKKAPSVSSQATQNGVQTGFEPRILDKLPTPISNHMFGTPGAGLSKSGFGNTAVKLGQEGELRFAKALVKAKLLEPFASYWSLAMPQPNGVRDASYQSDIDCVVLTENSLYLIDLKNYKQGAVSYHTVGDMLHCQDSVTGNEIGTPKKLSQNNAMAMDRFRAFARGVTIKPRVVLMPTDKGMGEVRGATFPGGIPVVTLPELLRELNTESRLSFTKHRDLQITLTGLLKK